MKFKSYLKAGYPLLYCQTHEEARAISILKKEAVGYVSFQWDIVNGLVDVNAGEVRQVSTPVKAIQFMTTAPESSLLFVKDFHKWITSIEVIRNLKIIKGHLEATDKHIIIISPIIEIPIELQKDITLIELPLPDGEELMKIARWAKAQVEQDNPELNIEIDEEVIKNAVGLTFEEAKNAFALSLVETKRFDKTIIEKEKLQAIKKTGLLELFNPVPESEIGGLEGIKSYIHNRKKGFYDKSLPTPKGILGVGLPGSGKSLFAKAVCSVLNLPGIAMNISSLKGSHVGESERKMREALNLIDAVSPCVVWIDEIEKSLSGVQSSARTDGGTTAAMFGYLLTWMQESTKLHYVVATCNDIGDLLAISQGALLRRFDDVFFFDLPTRQERLEILRIMNRRYNTNLGDEWVDRMENFTGAEIEKFVIASIYDGAEIAINNIRPVYYQNQEIIGRARQWAQFNARPANSSNGKAENQKKERRVKI